MENYFSVSFLIFRPISFIPFLPFLTEVLFENIQILPPFGVLQIEINYANYLMEVDLIKFN